MSQWSLILKLTRQAIFVAIRKGKLIAHQENRKWYIYEKDMQTYRENKYRRDSSKFQGLPLFDPEQKQLSVAASAKFMGCTPQKIYYLARTGQIPHVRKGNAIVISYDDLLKLKDCYDSLGRLRKEDKRQTRFA